MNGKESECSLCENEIAQSLKMSILAGSEADTQLKGGEELTWDGSELGFVG